jgi:putative glutamine amidotransferase
MIKIGVSACFMHPDPQRAFFGPKVLAYLEQDMARYLSRPGIMPILIPDLPEPEWSAFLAEMDGFVFQGGADLAPETYGETPIENGRWPGDPVRDLYELRIMKYAFDRKKPIFAICRGFQLTNAFFGGTLYQDLKTQNATQLTHRDAALYDRIHHEIAFEPESYLKKIYPPSGSQPLVVNSVHHQGIKDLGKGLVVDARCPVDGLIEAFHFHKMNENYVLAVQWHPEFSPTLGNQVIDPKPLYDDFLKAVQAQRK